DRGRLGVRASAENVWAIVELTQEWVGPLAATAGNSCRRRVKESPPWPSGDVAVVHRRTQHPVIGNGRNISAPWGSGPLDNPMIERTGNSVGPALATACASIGRC